MARVKAADLLLMRWHRPVLHSAFWEELACSCLASLLIVRKYVLQEGAGLVQMKEGGGVAVPL